MSEIVVQGERWPITITTWDIAQVQRRAGFRLNHLLTPNSTEMQELSEDTVRLLDVLEVLLDKELERRGMTAEDLFRKFGEETSEQAFFAILDAMVDYLPEPQRRTASPLATALRNAHRKVKDQAQRNATHTLSKTTPEQLESEMEQVLWREMNRSTSSNSPTSSPGLSE